MCPPGTDQTTRTRPRWVMLAPKLEEKFLLPALDPTKAGTDSARKFLREGLSWNAFAFLARTSLALDDRAMSILPAPLARTMVMSSALERLPSELLNIIIGGLDSSDKVALALCSQHLWCHSVRELQLSYRRSTALWAGTPIICTSSWLEELPESISDLFPEVAKAQAEWVKVFGTRFYPSHGKPPARRWLHRDCHGYTEPNVGRLERTYVEAFEAHAPASQIPKVVLDKLRSKLKMNELSSDKVLPTSRWTLRNHSTHEIVHMVASKADNDDAVQLAVKSSPWLTLDFVLTSNIVWTKDEFIVKKGQRTRFDRGRWAGHCFDVVPSVEFKKKEDWIDVTRGVTKRAQTLRSKLQQMSYL